jgi:hypothetical protein
LFFLALVAGDDGGAYSYINVLGTNGVLGGGLFQRETSYQKCSQ